MLNAKALGLAGGLLWGLCMFVLTFVGMYVSGYGSLYYELLMSVYPGYELSVGGAFLGFLYGFADGVISLFLFGWLYNVYAGNGMKTVSKKKK